MSFLKKNKFLTFIIMLTLAVSVTLLLFVLRRKKEMQTIALKLDRNLKKIEEINSVTPAPVAKNETILQDDVDGLRYRLESSYLRFGAPSRLPFRAVIKELAFTTNKNIIDAKTAAEASNAQDFFNYVDELSYKKKTEIANKFNLPFEVYDHFSEDITTFLEIQYKRKFRKFIKSYEGGLQDTVTAFFEGECIKANVSPAETVSLIKRIQKTFVDELAKEFVINAETPVIREPVEDLNEWLLNAFDVPMVLEEIPRKCKNDFMIPFKENMTAVLKKSQILLFDKAKNFGFDDYLDRRNTGNFPEKEEIPEIIRQMRAIAGCVYVLQKNGVSEINAITTEEPFKEDQFAKYGLEIQFTSPLQIFRDVINDFETLMPLKNKIYKITDVALITPRNSIKEFDTITKRLKAMDRRSVEEYTTRGGKGVLEPYLRAGYGITVIGNDTVKATIKLDYIQYIGNNFSLSE